MKNLEIIKLLRKKLNKILLRITSYKFNTNIIKSNKTIIFIFSLTFLYLCYLSIPALYNEIIIKERKQKETSLMLKLTSKRLLLERSRKIEIKDIYKD